MVTLSQLNEMFTAYMTAQNIDYHEAQRQLKEFFFKEVPVKYQVGTYSHLIEYQNTPKVVRFRYNDDIRELVKWPREYVAAGSGVGPIMMKDFDRLVEAAGLTYADKLPFDKNTPVVEAMGFAVKDAETISALLIHPRYKNNKRVKVIKKLLS